MTTEGKEERGPRGGGQTSTLGAKP